MNSEPLLHIAPPRSSDRRLSPDTVVWHLGLEQITSGSGTIENRIFAPLKDAGTSTFIFDERNVLYSKLRPFLNKVICPDSIGVATTELVPLRPDPIWPYLIRRGPPRLAAGARDRHRRYSRCNARDP